MHRTAFLLLLATLCPPLAAGCPDGHGRDPSSADGGADGGRDGSPAPPSDGGPPLSAEERFFRDYQRALCECAVEHEHSERLWDLVDDACHPRLSIEWVAAARQLLAEGDVRFDAAAASACLSYVTGELDCDEWQVGVEPPRDSVCADVFVGLAPDGAECWDGLPTQCGPDSYCDHGLPDHTCQPRLAPGTECERGECATSGEGGGCVDGRCRGLAAEGDPCTESYECMTGLFCVEGACAPAHEGMPCSGSCGSELRCDDGACVRGIPVGEPCPDVSAPCESGSACYGDPLVCMSTRGDAPGDLCRRSPWFGSDTCDGDLVCQLETPHWDARGVCVTGQPAGAACSAARPCDPGHVCTDGVCRRGVGPGAACDADTVCPWGHVCTSGTCAPLPLPGEPCDARVGCLQGSCVEGICCVEPAGTACSDSTTRHSTCSGECNDGECADYGDCSDRCAPGTTCWARGYGCAPVCSRP